MKPLELIVYPKLERPRTVAEIMPYREQWRREHALQGAKHLTDAELAAEMFRQAAWLGANGRTYKTDEGRNIVIEAAFTFGPITRDEHQWLTVNRFATLPHYDEVAQ
jgi:hypothetical protein